MGVIDPNFLAEIPIFGGLQPAFLTRIVQHVKLMDYPGDTAVVGEGDLAREMFVVREGSLEVCKRGAKGDEVRLAVLRPGDCVGEMSLIDIQPRSASVRTLGPSKLLVLSNVDLGQLFHEDPESYTLLVLNIAREISRRLRRADSLLAEMMLTAQDLWARKEEPLPAPVAKKEAARSARGRGRR